MYADSGQRRSRRHYVSRAIMAPGGGGGLTSTASWRLWSKRSERNNRLLAVTAFSVRKAKGTTR